MGTERLMGMAVGTETVDKSLMEAAIGEAKYEHVYRAVVWRIPRLPEKHHGAYKNHLLRCRSPSPSSLPQWDDAGDWGCGGLRFELSSFDLMPEAFSSTVDVEFTMPMSTVSHTVVRSVSLDRHEDPDRVEKFVRYISKYQYQVTSSPLLRRLRRWEGCGWVCRWRRTMCKWRSWTWRR